MPSAIFLQVLFHFSLTQRAEIVSPSLSLSIHKSLRYLIVFATEITRAEPWCKVFSSMKGVGKVFTFSWFRWSSKNFLRKKSHYTTVVDPPTAFSLAGCFAPNIFSLLLLLSSPSLPLVFVLQLLCGKWVVESYSFGCCYRLFLQLFSLTLCIRYRIKDRARKKNWT